MTSTEGTSTEGASGVGAGLRTGFGAVLFIAWGVATVLWVYSAVLALVGGEAGPAIRGVCALLLMILLAGMEGLEVAVIDRWRQLYPERSTSDLAGWLAARQLFVALICTTATLLAEPELVAVPFSSVEITGGFALKAFTIVWTGLTLLWFMQIFPKHMAATNPDRYLRFTQPTLFPVVEVVRKIGIAQPGEWVAWVAQSRLDWHAEPGIELETPSRRGTSLTEAWAALVPDRAPTIRRSPDERAGGPTES
jgi:hypothetical protein